MPQRLFCYVALNHSVFTVKFYGQAERAISNGQLNALLRLHIRPIDVVVFHGPSYLTVGRSHLEEGFTLICFQRLSRPDFATQLCPSSKSRVRMTILFFALLESLVPPPVLCSLPLPLMREPSLNSISLFFHHGRQCGIRIELIEKLCVCFEPENFRSYPSALGALRKKCAKHVAWLRRMFNE